MNNFRLKPTKNSPYINFDFNKGILEIKGRSCPDNALALYNPIREMIKDYRSIDRKLKIYFSLEFFNTSSTKCIHNLLKEANNLRKLKFHIEMVWYVEEDDEDMVEIVEDIMEMFPLEYRILELPYNDLHNLKPLNYGL